MYRCVLSIFPSHSLRVNLCRHQTAFSPFQFTIQHSSTHLRSKLQSISKIKMLWAECSENMKRTHSVIADALSNASTVHVHTFVYSISPFGKFQDGALACFLANQTIFRCNTYMTTIRIVSKIYRTLSLSLSPLCFLSFVKFTNIYTIDRQVDEVTFCMLFSGYMDCL